jgi:phosphoadenosine phosphosulfate reductase
VRVRKEDIEPVNRALSAREPLGILKLVFEAFGSRAGILSSMQRAGTAMCHMADAAGLAFDVLFVDTGVLHPETLATRDRLVEAHPRMRVRTLGPGQSFAEQTRQRGLLYLTKEGQEECCELRKTRPLLALRGEYDVLVGALRRDEGGRRSLVDVVELDGAMGALRVHPFAYLSRADLERYVEEHPDVVQNPLHAMGFATIGCFPCTTPVRPDEDERAGRWRHLADVAYCGINPTDSAGASAEVTVSDRCARFLERALAPSP